MPEPTTSDKTIDQINAEFAKAANDSKKLTSKPNNDELLDLYGLFKVANKEDIASAPVPGVFDLKEKTKRKAWQKKVDDGITPEQAKNLYIELVEKLKKNYGYDPEKVSETIGGDGKYEVIGS